MTKRYMDFVPKQRRTGVSQERAEMLAVAPEREATVDFEATVASAAATTEVIEEEQVTVKIGTKKPATGAAEAMPGSTGVVSRPVRAARNASAPTSAAPSSTGVARGRRMMDVARKPGQRAAKMPLEASESAQVRPKVQTGVEGRPVARGGVGRNLAGSAERRDRSVNTEMRRPTVTGVESVNAELETSILAEPRSDLDAEVDALGREQAADLGSIQGLRQAEPVLEDKQATPMAEGAVNSNRKSLRQRKKVSRTQKRFLERRERTPKETETVNENFALQLMEEVPLDANLLNDPMERPISEFADLEELAQEIEEVTRGGAVVDEEMSVVESEFRLQSEEPRFGVIEDYRPRFIEAKVEKRPLSRGAGAASMAGAASEAAVVSGAAAKMAGAAAGMAGATAGVTGAARAAGAASAAGAARAAAQNEALKRAKQAKVRAQAFGRPGVNPGVTRPGAARAATARKVNVAGAGAVDAAPSPAGAVDAASSPAGAVNAAARAADQTKMKIPQAHFINQNKVAKRPLSKTVYATQPKATSASEAAAPVQVVKPKKKGGALGMILAIIITVILGAVAGTAAFLLLPR